MWWMSDVALRGVLLQGGALSSEVARDPQLKQVWPTVAPAVSGTGRRNTGGGGGRALGAIRWCSRWGGQGAHYCWWRWCWCCCGWRGGLVGPWWYTVQYFRGALPDGVPTTFFFLVSLWAWIASSVIMILLMNSRNVPPVLSAMHSCSLVERSIMKWSFFSSVSTWSSAYYAMWLNCLE
jgi:hypothetical protein